MPRMRMDGKNAAGTEVPGSFLRSTARQKSCCASVMSSAAATFLRIDLRSFPRFSCLA